MSGTIIHNGIAYSEKISQSSHSTNISSLASNITTSVNAIPTDTLVIGVGRGYRYGIRPALLLSARIVTIYTLCLKHFPFFNQKRLYLAEYTRGGLRIFHTQHSSEFYYGYVF